MKQRLFLDTLKCSLHQFVITSNEEKIRVASGILRPYPIFIGYKHVVGKAIVIQGQLYQACIGFLVCNDTNSSWNPFVEINTKIGLWNKPFVFKKTETGSMKKYSSTQVQVL